MSNNFSSYNRGFSEGAAFRGTERPAQFTKEVISIKIDNTKSRDRQHRREMKLKAFAGWTFLAGLCWGLTPYFFSMAQAYRNNTDIGSEVIIPLIPFFCFLLYIVENKRK